MDKGKKLQSVTLFRVTGSVRYVKLLIDGKMVKFDLFSEFHLTRKSVKSKYYHEAEQFQFFRSLLSNARNHLWKAEGVALEAHSALTVGYQAKFEEAEEPRTEWYCKRLADINKSVLKAHKIVRKWKNQVDILSGIVSGMEHLKGMIMSAGAQDRKHTTYLSED